LIAAHTALLEWIDRPTRPRRRLSWAPMDLTLQLVTVVLLLLANAIFVLAEFSFASVRRERITDLAEQGQSWARSVLDALDNLERYVPAIQLGVTMSSIALGWVGVPALARLIQPGLESVIGETAAFVTSGAIALGVAFLLLTLLHVALAELVPKSVALQYPEPAARSVLLPVRLTLAIFRPLNFIIREFARRLLAIFGVEPATGPGRIYTEDELRNIVAASRIGGELVKTEEEIIRRAFVFHDYNAESIMVPRTELIALPLNVSWDELLEALSTHRFGRYPVYERDIDDIQGILYVKELAPILATSSPGEMPAIAAIMRPAFTVPTSIPIDALLEEMRTRGTHLAIVVDEYGGTAGMVTLDDILERVLGEVPDEFERTAPDIVAEVDGWARVDGLTLLSDINDHFDLELQADETNTIGGFVFFELGHRPRVGDTIMIDGYAVRVERLDGLRISQVRFIPTERGDEYAQPESSSEE
jgi:CBS domain containing-hemolysin-like protein